MDGTFVPFHVLEQGSPTPRLGPGTVLPKQQANACAQLHLCEWQALTSVCEAPFVLKWSFAHMHEWPSLVQMELWACAPVTHMEPFPLPHPSGPQSRKVGDRCPKGGVERASQYSQRVSRLVPWQKDLELHFLLLSWEVYIFQFAFQMFWRTHLCQINCHRYLFLQLPSILNCQCKTVVCNHLQLILKELGMVNPG